ncbi:DNA topoisomerase 3 [Alloprevotella tannerae]
MIVCIAEKPSVARDIARILGATKQCEGYLEGNGYQVTWTFGHLCELKYPEDYTPEWKYWSLGRLPMIPQRFGIRVKQDAGIQKQFDIICQLYAAAEEIINCGDAGQEGELIQRWVMQKAGVKCPVKRLWISSMTDEAIREGFAALRTQQQYDSLYAAGLCRAIGDWVLGMNATRLYTLKYGQRGSTPLSIGRVQTPTLALIVRRQAEIEHFKPEPYWVLATIYRKTTFTAVLKEGERGFRSEEEGQRAFAAIQDVPFTVKSVEKKNGTEAPPRLFDLTSLQVACNKKWGYSADKTLQLIQALYEKKVTTYPRVDTTYLSEDIYPKCKTILNGIGRTTYAPLLQPLRGEKLLKRKKVFDTSKVTDHHAIIPTGQAADNLLPEERNVYDLIARRFIAIFYPDCKFATTTVFGQAGDTLFRVSGKEILTPGWRSVFQKEKSEEEVEENENRDEERTLPTFTVGESGPHRPTLQKKLTQAPKPYTEATLLRAMETAGKAVEDEELRDLLKENGIGRPSTRAAIIETLFRRNYITKTRKALFATPTGVELIGLIKEELLKSAELTGLWEKRLREIERKEYEPQTFIEGMKTMIGNIVTEVLNDNSNRHVTAAPNPTDKHKKQAAATADPDRPKAKRIRAGSVCPLCGQGKVIKGREAYGCSRWKEGCTFRKPFKT